jgi:hypothetical protein
VHLQAKKEAPPMSLKDGTKVPPLSSDRTKRTEMKSRKVGLCSRVFEPQPQPSASEDFV